VGVGHDVPVVAPERGIDPTRLLDERRDELWITAEPILEVRSFGENAYARAGEAGRRFTSSRDEQEEDRERFLVGELPRFDRLCTHPDQTLGVVVLGASRPEVDVHHRADVHHRWPSSARRASDTKPLIASTEAYPCSFKRGAASSGRPRILATMII